MTKPSFAEYENFWNWVANPPDPNRPRRCKMLKPARNQPRLQTTPPSSSRLRYSQNASRHWEQLRSFAAPRGRERFSSSCGFAAVREYGEYGTISLRGRDRQPFNSGSSAIRAKERSHWDRLRKSAIGNGVTSSASTSTSTTPLRLPIKRTYTDPYTMDEFLQDEDKHPPEPVSVQRPSAIGNGVTSSVNTHTSTTPLRLPIERTYTSPHAVDEFMQDKYPPNHLYLRANLESVLASQRLEINPVGSAALNALPSRGRRESRTIQRPGTTNKRASMRSKLAARFRRVSIRLLLGRRNSV